MSSNSKQETDKAFGAISKGIGYIARQPRDWKVVAVRNSGHNFFYNLILPYLSIYIVALGASAAQLGLVNSIGHMTAGLFALVSGWLVDRWGVKPVILIGGAFISLAFLIYWLAQDWTVAIIGMSLFWVGFFVSGTSCSTVCGVVLKSEHRATTMNICHSTAAGVGVISPVIGAALVTAFGGVNIEGIRLLFLIGFIGYCPILVFLATQLSSALGGSLDHTSTNIVRDISSVFKLGQNLKRMLIFFGLGNLHLGLILPFTSVFAYEVKGAEQYVLGAMVTGMGLTALVFGIPFGRLADRIGRKRSLYMLTPLSCASNLLLILAPSPSFLIAAGVMQGFYFIMMSLTVAMTIELVPKGQTGRYMGVTSFVMCFVTAVTALLGGAIWEFFGPVPLFLSAIAIDLFVRIPLLVGIPETLRRARGE